MPRNAGHLRAYRSYAAFSLLIDGRLCDFSQSFVGSLFLFESFLKKRDRVLKTKFTNCVLIGDYAYGLSDSTLECVNWRTGKSQWKKGRYGQGQILGVGDALLVQAEPGFVALIAATPDKFIELGRLEAMNDKTWNNLCVYRNLLLVRNSVEAVCYELTLAND